MKTIVEINEKIRKGKAVIVRADEMHEIVEKHGPKKAAQKVDIVTTATFGAMCSSGAFINFGHSDPPIKMEKVFLNDVEAYTGLAAVDAYIGATQLSEIQGMDYGGAHVIEDLVAGKTVELRATAYGTDCYPRKSVETSICLDDVNQAYMFNPRNNYQRYNAATNTSDKILHTYMGVLLPHKKNVNFAGTGELSPLLNDPEYRSLGLGTKIFLCGGQGFIVSEGTQHSPTTGFGTIAVSGELREMDTRFLRAATMPDYGTTLYVGIGVPIPILDEKLAKATAVTNADIKTSILDYSVPRLSRPKISEVTYEELFSGTVELDGASVKTAAMSSLKVTNDILSELASWIEDKKFYLTEPVKRLARDTVFKPMKLSGKIVRVGDVMTKKLQTASQEDSVEHVSNIMIAKNINQVPIVGRGGKLVGIVTSWDITKATAEKKRKLADFMTKKVITSTRDESLDVAARKLEKHGINSTPVIDEKGKLIGIITLSDITRAYRQKK
ncbi:MAG: homocysteine biosynthesis protein [Candidatus Altiarchaeota archaeon]